MTDNTCKKCGGKMKPSKTIEQTYVGGTPDFPRDKHSTTFTAGGSGNFIDCMKCCECGWSVTREPTMRELQRLG